MKTDLLAALDASHELYRAKPFMKLLRSPFKLLRPKLLSTTSPRLVKARTFWGETMSVIIPEPVSLCLYRYGFFEYEMTRALIQQFEPGMTFFDVGAHFGYFTCLASFLAGSQGQVHSFEPTRSTFEILSSNAGRRGNVTLNNTAAYSHAAQIQFNDFGTVYSAYNSFAAARMSESERSALRPKTYQVQTLSLDEYVEKTSTRPNFVKIDAESAEVPILKGMLRTLQKIRPAVAVEVGDFELNQVASSSEIVKFLVDAGYAPFDIGEEGLSPHRPQANYAFGNLIFLPL